MAITTPFALFEFPFMSFDLRKAARTFQRFMDEILRVRFLLCQHRWNPGILTNRSTSNKYEHSPSSYRPTGCCSTPANVFSEPQNSRSLDTGSQTMAHSRCRPGSRPPGMPNAPDNPSSSKVTGDSELLPPVPNSCRSHTNVSAHPPQRPT